MRVAPAEPLRVVIRGGKADCAIVAIALYTGREYADVMFAAQKADPRWIPSAGMKDRHIRRVMTALEMPVRYTSKVDYDDHYGLLRLSDHIVVLKRGQIINPHSTWVSIWDADDFILHSGFCKLGEGDVHGIFLVKE